ncbi:MAG: FkbM family methyltransferase [Bryobacteraceae bacterium]
MRSLMVGGVRKFHWNEWANDLWIREVIFPGKRNGYFVEAGAADGVGGSSCLVLERHLGWTGICIEPSSRFFPQLKQNRPKSVCVNLCLANHGGTVDFVEAREPYLSGVRGALLHCKAGGEESVATGVSSRRRAAKLVDLLREHGAPRRIEYGAFDIEGSEYEALRDFPFEEYRFLALSLEVDGRIAQPITALLAANGYRETSNPFNEAGPWERYWVHESIAS